MQIPKNSFNILAFSKDYSDVKQSIDVSKATDIYLKEFGGVQYVDDVINDYFGGNYDFET